MFEEDVVNWVALEAYPSIVCWFQAVYLDSQPLMNLEQIAGEKGRGTNLCGWMHRSAINLRSERLLLIYAQP